MKATNNLINDRSKNHWLLAIFLSASVIVSSCSDSGSNDDSKSDQSSKVADVKDKKDEKPPVPVEVVSVARGDIQQTYRTITTLEAENEVQVVARSTGLLQGILVEEGDTVVKGQLMAQLDIEQLSLEVAQLKATSKKLNKELERQQSLFARKLGSSDTLDRAKFEYEAQFAQLKLAKLKLNYASIKAPIGGIVTERLVKQGNLIRDNDMLFKIVDLSTLKAVLHLPEKELANVRKQQQILLKVDAMGDQVIIGEIERIRPTIDTSTGTFRVVAKLNNDNNFLKSGMFGKVEVVFDIHQGSLLIEQQAVITQDNRSHVFIVKENKAIQTPVTVGFQHNGVFEITDGLTENDHVITTGQQIIKHETLVEIVGLNGQIVETKTEEATSNKAQSPSTVASNP
ncbi:MAG: efflux RND transporter periplasmic adaptor subunit [Kangiellaceae bacterium]|nr:efflux RND transporter periplasmic adaptor subunit [Kangiellaceae bacterium]